MAGFALLACASPESRPREGIEVSEAELVHSEEWYDDIHGHAEDKELSIRCSRVSQDKVEVTVKTKGAMSGIVTRLTFLLAGSTWTFQGAQATYVTDRGGPKDSDWAEIQVAEGKVVLDAEGLETGDPLLCSFYFRVPIRGDVCAISGRVSIPADGVRTDP
jgi:hypothetical protein